MQKPSIIKLNRAVAKTAFLLPVSNWKNVELVVSRLGLDSKVGSYRPVDRDEHGYLEFVWDKKFNDVRDGLYLASFYECDELISTAIIQIKKNCIDVIDAISSEGDCALIGNHCATGCDSEAEIYVPKYVIGRGCK